MSNYPSEVAIALKRSQQLIPLSSCGLGFAKTSTKSQPATVVSTASQ